jgi:putative virion core protein (lumpy skin disease virus)
MGLIKAATDSLGGTLADQWLDLITAGYFDEHTVVAPGVLKSTNNGRGSNLLGSQGVISNGSKIFVPENTAAYIFSQGGIETVVSEPGPYEYQDGESSIFRGGNSDSLFRQLGDRFSHGGISSSEKRIAFVNLREIRDIKFGTRGLQVYNDHYYECDLEIYAYGGFSVKVVDADKFIRNFVPANISSYTFDDPKARGQMVSEFLQSFIVALNGMSSTYRISQLPAQAVEIAKRISEDTYNAGSWPERFGMQITKVAIENIELSDHSRQLVNQFSSNRMNVRAYEDTSERAGNMAAQQRIAQGIQDNGLGEGGGMLFGMNMVQAIGPQGQPAKSSAHEMSTEEKIEMLKKLKELVDMGILTQDEFDLKKKELLGL